MDLDHPLEGALEHWEALAADATATAEEYREDGWGVLELHPGDVTMRRSMPGFDVLVPDDELDALAELLESVDVERSEVFRATGGGVQFALVAFEAPADREAVLLPLYYTVEDVVTLDQLLEEPRVVDFRIRRLDETSVGLSVQEVELFLPTGEG